MSLHRILLASASAATVLLSANAFADCATTCVPSSDPSVVDSEQTHVGPVVSDTRIEIDTALDAAANATAGGSTLSAGADGHDLRVNSAQTSTGSVAASAWGGFRAVHGYAVGSSYGFANGFAASAKNGDLTAAVTQNASGPVSSRADLDGQIVGADAMASLAATAVGNAASLAAVNGDISATVEQNAAGAVSAVADADLTACCGDASATAMASGNNYVASGETTTMQTTVAQARGDQDVTALSDVYVGGSSGTVVGVAVANGNAATFDNAWGYTSATATQTNAGNVSAQSWVTVDDACCAAASALGVGNTLTASNIGSDMQLNFSQANEGDVRAWSGLAGSAASGSFSSTAMGNASSGTLCTTCGEAILTASNVQRNAGGVEAIGVARMSQGSIIGSASAFGNAATFYAGSGH